MVLKHDTACLLFIPLLALDDKILTIKMRYLVGNILLEDFDLTKKSC